MELGAVEALDNRLLKRHRTIFLIWRFVESIQYMLEKTYLYIATCLKGRKQKHKTEA